jgi:ribosomal protein S27AE
MKGEKAMKTKKCPWYDKEICQGCGRTKEEFIEKCRQEEFFIEMARQCPHCKTGIINPTFDKTMACDKCGYNKPLREVAKIYKDLGDWSDFHEH